MKARRRPSYATVHREYIPQHAALFGLRREGLDRHVLEFRRGSGFGAGLADLSALALCRRDGAEGVDELLVRAAEALAGEIRSRLEAEDFAQHLAALWPSERDFYADRISVFVLWDEEADIMARLGDFAWRHVWETASNDIDTVTISDAFDEVCLLETCSTSPVGIFTRKDGACQVVSARAILEGGRGYGDAPRIVSGMGEVLWGVHPVRLVDEWSGRLSDRSALEKLDEAAAKHGTDEGYYLIQDIAEGVRASLDAELAALGAPALVHHDAASLYFAAIEAPLTLGGCSEERLGQLVKWIGVLDEATDEAVKVHGVAEADRERFGFFMSEFYEGEDQQIDIAAAWGGHPAGIAHKAPMAPGLHRVLEEILAFADPRGTAPHHYETNRASSVEMGPGRRTWLFDWKGVSGHEILAATEGLTAFLLARGYSRDDAAGLLSVDPGSSAREALA